MTRQCLVLAIAWQALDSSTMIKDPVPLQLKGLVRGQQTGASRELSESLEKVVLGHM